MDAYNRCQFGCEYCFAATRAGHGRRNALQAFKAEVFRSRMERVNRGEFASALDEFLSRRIPIQLGGMSDPFSPIEMDLGHTQKLMQVLKEYSYPYVISARRQIRF